MLDEEVPPPVKLGSEIASSASDLLHQGLAPLVHVVVELRLSSWRSALSSARIAGAIGGGNGVPGLCKKR